MGTLVCKSSFGLKLQGRVRDALISPEHPLARAGAARSTGSSTTIVKIPKQTNTIGPMTRRLA